MQVTDFLVAAGVDPYATAEAVLSAEPGAVAALGEAFICAAAALQSSGGLSALAGELADDSASFDGVAPTELMAEVLAVQQTLAAGPEVLHAIGAPLDTLAGEIAKAQQQVSAALIELEENAVPILQSYALSAEALTVGAVAWWNQHIAAGVAIVQAAYGAVSEVVDAHDARLVEVLLGLQAVGYLLPPDADAGLSAPPAAGGSWAGGTGIGPYHRGTTEKATAMWWATLTAAEQAVMVQMYPKLLTLMHGLPSQTYHLANLREVVDDRAGMDLELAELAQIVWDDPQLTDGIKQSMSITGPADIAELSTDQLDEFGVMLPSAFVTLTKMMTVRVQKETIDGVQKSITAGDDSKKRYLLEYDLEKFDGDGAAVIGIGEVDTADNVAVVVQGATHDLGSIVAQTADAEAVLTEMDALSDQENAVVVYEGYDNPAVSEALFDGQASQGGLFLADDLAGFEAAHEQAAGTPAHVTVIGHSYGTVVAAYAMQYGANPYADDFVLYGSPGLGVGHVLELGKDPEHVYIGVDSSDILVQLDGFTEAVSWNHLGPDPADPRFGATVLGTDGVDGHGDYFGYDAGQPNQALQNAAAVAIDEPQKAVVVAEAAPLPASPDLCLPP